MSQPEPNNFDTGDMSNALSDVTNSKGTIAPGVNEEAALLAREKGWVAPEKYNYEAYNATGGKEREETEASHALPAWGHNAQRYEWSEEYGDVGPKIEELEQLLFRSDFQQRTGMKFEKYVSFLKHRSSY